MSESRDMFEESHGSDSTRHLSPAPVPNVRVLPARYVPRSNANAVSPTFVLHMLRQWWKVAAPVGILLAIVAGAVVYMLFEPQYEASAWLRIRGERPFLAFPFPNDQNAADVFVKTQVETIRCPLVIGPVVGRADFPKLSELEDVDDPILWLGKQVTVSSVGQSELFRISFACASPQSAATVVNLVADQFFKLNQQDNAEQSREVIDLLNQETETRKMEVRRLRENVRELAKQVTGKDPFAANAEEDTPASHPLSNLDRRLTEARVEQVVLLARITAYQSQAHKETIDTSSAMFDKAVEENAEVRRLEEQIAAEQAKSKELKNISAKGEQEPLYQQLLAKIAGDEATLEEVRKELRPQVLAEMQTVVNSQREQELARMQSEMEEYKALETYLDQEYQRKLQDAQTLSGDTVDLQFKQTELARAEEVHNLISERVLKLRTEQRAPDRIKLMRAAIIPEAPLVAFPYRNMFLMALAGLCLPFALAVGWEHLVRRVNDAEQLEGQSNLKVMAEVTRFPVRTSMARKGSSSGRVKRDLMIFEESIDGLRTSLMLAEHLKGMKVLAVMSATRQEGKTSVAAQLAVSIARALGEKTLLIDGDLRSPDIHKIFEVPLEPGLAGVLGGDCPVEDAIVTSWSKYVHLLPAGKLRYSPHKLFGNGELKALLEEVRPMYRYIIVDTPPVLAASEALMLAKAADATLMCIMRDSSRIDQVRRAYQRLSAAGSTPVGTVLNGVPVKQYSTRYGTYAYSSD